MVNLPLYYDKEKKGGESTMLHKMNLGYSFKDDKNIFKNIHSFLKSKNKVAHLHNAQDHKETDLYRQPKANAQTSSDTIGESLTTPNFENPGTDDFFGTKSSPRDITKLAIKESDDIIDTSDGFNNIKKQPLIFSHNRSFCCSSNSETTSPFASSTQPDDDIILLPPKPNPAHLLRRNSNNSINNMTNSRSHRPNSSSIKKSRRSLKSNRESLKRYNSTDGSQTLASTQQPQSNVNTSTRNTHKSRLSESNIPFHHDENVTNDQFPRITAETLQRIVEEEIYKFMYDSYCIIDCRFEYEFKGGHVMNAVNISSREELEQEFIQGERKSPSLLIFHCEFSSYRGPMLASHLRNCDRIINYDSYPDLYYPDILILDGGYKGFFDLYPNLCFPKKYVGMDSSENLVSRDQEMGRFRQDSKRMISRNSSLHKLTSVSSSTKSSVKRTGSSQDLIIGTHRLKSLESPTFAYEAPPRLSLGRHSQGNIFGSSDDCSSASRLSLTSSPNLAVNKACLMDELDNDSCYSFDEGDSTFTTPIETLTTPCLKLSSNREQDNSELNPVKKLLFSNILMEEEGEASE